MLTVGIDIGGTKIAGGAVDAAGAIVERLRADTPSDAAAIADAVVGMVQALAERHQVARVGVAAAGFISKDRSTVIHAPNIAWRDEPLRDRLQSRLGLPVTLENDANAAGWAEYRYGAGRGHDHMVMLTLGTGVGGAIILDGELLTGGHGIAAELGHTRFVRGGRLCGCGQHGCLEQYASGRALQRAAGENADAGGVGARLAALRAERGRIPGREISRLAREGDPGAIEAVECIATARGEGCGGLQAVVDPEVFVIGGGVSQLGEDLLAPVRRAYEASVPGLVARPLAEFTTAQLGNDAGIIGAADLAARRD